MLCKVVEVVAESIPSGVLQAYAFLKSGGKMRAPLGACLVSVVTTAFTVTSLAYDIDTSPKKRRMNSSFYGFVPDKTSLRTASFVTILVFSTMHVGLRTLSSALLLLVNWKFLVYYMVGDMMLYLAYSVATRDFIIWVPIQGPLSVFVSFFKRIVEKIGADFTLCLHFRHPYEVKHSDSRTE